MENYEISIMTKSDLAFALELANKEGWNTGINDIEPFYEADNNGFFIGKLADKPIATLSAVNYGNGFGFMGFYIVLPEYRNQGYGIEIWKKGIEYLRGKNIGLDGVLEQQRNYEKSGFKLAYNNIRFEGKSKKYDRDKNDVYPFDKCLFPAICNYDRKHFPAKRMSFLNEWIKHSIITLCYSKNNIIKGYASIRRCREGYKIGPLFADNYNIAEELLKELNNRIEENVKIYLDVPSINFDGIKLIENYGMKKVFETVRMYTEELPKLNYEGVYGVTSFELG